MRHSPAQCLSNDFTILTGIGIVLTYAAEPLEGTKSLFGKTISTEASRKGPTIVRYETLEGDKHYFPIKQCKTWHVSGSRAYLSVQYFSLSETFSAAAASRVRHASNSYTVSHGLTR